MHHNIFFSLFDNRISVSMGKADMQLPSGITDIGYKGNVEVHLPAGKLKAGIDYNRHRVKVQYPQITNLYNIYDSSAPEPYRNDEFGIFADYSVSPARGLTLKAGLRYSGSTQTVMVNPDIEQGEIKLQDIPIKWAKVTVSDGEQEEVLVGRKSDGIFPPYRYTGVSIRGEAGKKYFLKVELTFKQYF